MSKDDGIKAVVVVGRNRAAMKAAKRYAAKGRVVYMIEEDGRVNGQEGGLLPGCGGKRMLDALEIRGPQTRDRIRFIANSVLEKVWKEGDELCVRIRKRPGFTIDQEKCNHCKECMRVCPVHMVSAGAGKAELRNAVDFDKETGVLSIIRESPICEETCPVKLDIRGYIGYIADGRYEEALRLIREKLPFPATIGRICTHPCEDQCNRGTKDAPLRIRDLKRFVGDYGLRNQVNAYRNQPKNTGRAVAVIGAGPAGLTCGHDLAILGHKVTIFERLPVAGGMLSTAIPEFRLPREIVQAEIDAIAKLGVEIRVNSQFGENFSLSALFGQGYESVFVAIGAQKSVRLRIPGEEAQGVLYGLPFLRDLSLNRPVNVRGSVAVIGGGNVALDAARAARRLGGSEVTILYRRSEEEMPASAEEIEAALSEGICIEYLVSPVEVLHTVDKISKLKCIRMKLSENDESGRKRPIPIAGTEYEMRLDMLIIAVGQLCDSAFINGAGLVQVTKTGTIQADPITQATGDKRVYAGGDCTTGPGTAIEAIAAGKRAAASIDRFLRQKEMKQ